MKYSIRICVILIIVFVLISIVVHHKLVNSLKNYYRENSVKSSSLLNNERVHDKHSQEIQTLKIRQKAKIKIPNLFKNFNGKTMFSELDVTPYSAFTYDKLFSTSTLYKHNVERQTGKRKFHLHAILNDTIKHLNFKLTDFQIGFYRVSLFDGLDYKLLFKHNSSNLSLVELKPSNGAVLNELDLKVTTKQTTQNDIINFIIPLWGDRFDSFKKFLKTFEIICKEDNHRSTLTIVYMSLTNSNTSYGEFKKILNDFERRSKYLQIKFLNVQSNSYSRAKALKIGVENCCGRSVSSLLFFCDVDVVFNKQLLDMCRLSTIRNKQIFYPILFSFYNPRLFDANNGLNLTINQENGFWRDFGFGMTCQYKEDFLNVNGFNDISEQLSGWGDEDLYLYRKYVNNKKNVNIFRPILPGIFHLYHEKQCNKAELNKKQYSHCLSSKVLNEASHRFFGFKYFNLSLLS